MTNTPSNLKSYGWLAGLRAFSLALWLLAIVIMALPLYVLRRYQARAALVHVFFVVAVRIVGLHIKKEGEFSGERPLMLVTNHCSYMDIFVVGACVPVSFTPKSDIASWPVIGFLCKLADCVFVERRPAKMREAQKEMMGRINRGKVLCLFPEGTTNEGDAVKPFKSGFFSLAEPAEGRAALPVQPATLVYTHLNGQIISTAEQRHKIAWVGDDALMPHLWQFLGMRSVTVEVLVGPVLRHDAQRGRKEICKQSEELIGGAMALRNKQLLQEAA